MMQSAYDSASLPQGRATSSPPRGTSPPKLEHTYWRGTGYMTAAALFERGLGLDKQEGPTNVWNPGFETADGFLARLERAEARDGQGKSLARIAIFRIAC
jgi:hypothetical protein